MWKFQVRLAVRYLQGRKLRSFLTTLAIIIGTMMIFGTNIMLPAMMASFQSNVQAISGQVDVTITRSSGEAFSRSVASRVGSLAAVKDTSPSLTRTVNIPAGYYPRGNVSALSLTGIIPQAAQRLRRYPIEEGRFLSGGDTHSAVITRSLADELGLQLGDRLGLPTTGGNVNLKLVGILPARALPGNEEVLVTLAEAQSLLNLPARINTIELNLATDDPGEREAAAQAIQASLGEDYTLGALAAGGEFMAAMQTGKMAFNLFGAIALFMGAFIIFNTFRTIVAERRHDIGMLRAIGADRRTIIGSILVEGLIQGLGGTLIGIILGYGLGAGTLRLMTSVMRSMLHLEIGAPTVTPGVVLMTLAAGIGVTLLAGLLPARNASRVTPLEALRPAWSGTRREKPHRTGWIGGGLVLFSLAALLSGKMEFTALGALTFLAGLVLAAPVLVRPLAAFLGRFVLALLGRSGTGLIARSSLARNPGRAAVTASATMIGLAVIVSLGGMTWSITGGFLGVLQRSLGSDFLLMPPAVAVWGSNVGASADLAERLRSVPGVEVVSTLRYAKSATGSTQFSLLAINPPDYTRVASLTFLDGDPSSAYAEVDRGKAVILNGILAAQTGYKVGDQVPLTTARGIKLYQVAGIAGDYLNAKVTTAYISQANLLRDYHKDEDIFYQINIAKGADPAAVEGRLQRLLEDYPQFKLVSGEGYFNENKQLFNAVFAFFYILLGILTAPSLLALLNTLSIGVIERTREIGMLRAIGATRRQVRRTVLVESLLLALVGTLFGLLSGLYMGYVMILGLKVSGFPVQYSFPYQGLIAAVVTGITFGLIAASIPSRQAERMEIVQALRFE